MDKIERFGKIRWYFEKNHFTGWKPDTFLRDLEFDIRHAKHFEKVAMVGEKKWQKWITDLMKPFTSGTVKYFNLSERENAKECPGACPSVALAKAGLCGDY